MKVYIVATIVYPEYEDVGYKVKIEKVFKNEEDAKKYCKENDLCNFNNIFEEEIE